VKVFWLRTQDTPWGDYGQILLNGMSSHLPRLDGKLQLERAGPYVPPITFPRRGDVVVTDALRSRFDERSDRPLPVKPLVKARIVKLDWEQWPRDRLPEALPPSRDPEDLILLREHDEVTSDQIGSLWELDPISCGTGTYQKVRRRPAEFRVIAQVREPCLPLFRVTGVPVVCVREDIGELLLVLTDGGLRLEPVELTITNG
jgi:hypothetical protein